MLDFLGPVRILHRGQLVTRARAISAIVRARGRPCCRCAPRRRRARSASGHRHTGTPWAEGGSAGGVSPCSALHRVASGNRSSRVETRDAGGRAAHGVDIEPRRAPAAPLRARAEPPRPGRSGGMRTSDNPSRATPRRTCRRDRGLRRRDVRLDRLLPVADAREGVRRHVQRVRRRRRNRRVAPRGIERAGRRAADGRTRG